MTLEQGLLNCGKEPADRFDLDQSLSSTDTQRKRRISREGLLLIKSFEGFRPQAVPRRDGVLTLGYGHTLTAREGIVITEAEAELLLLHDLIAVVDHLHSRIRRPLTQNQFDALASFVFSVGVERCQTSEVLELVREGRMKEAAAALAAVPERRAPAIDLPYRRRCAEKALFELPAARRPGLADLLLAPVSRPGEEQFALPEIPFGETGVVRHEDPVSGPVSGPFSGPALASRRRRPRSKPGNMAFSIVTCVFIGIAVGTGAVTALRHGLDNPAPDGQGLLIGLGLCAAGAVFLALAFWAVNSGARASRPLRQG